MPFRCDGDPNCKLDPHRAPVIMVPHKFVFGQRLEKPRRMFTDLHYCDWHRVNLDDAKLLEALLSARVKQDFEAAAKIKWPLGYSCDFEKARVEWVLVTTPEYRNFLASLGYAGIMGAAKLGTDEQRALRAELGARKIAG